jgi:hypothetical protein
VDILVALTRFDYQCDTIFVGGHHLMDVIAALQAEANKLKKQLDTVLHAMHLLGKSSKSKKVPIKRRRMSAAGKARIAAAQKKRWAKVRAAKKKAA